MTRRGSPTIVYSVALVPTSARQKKPIVARAEISDGILHKGVVRSVATLAALGLVVLLVAVFVADRVSRGITAPLRDLALAAARMRDVPQEPALPEGGTTEVAALAAALNRLAARIRQLRAGEREAVADLSHRLRTPVTALKLDTEFVEDRDVAERLRGHVTQLERTVDAIVNDAKRPSRSDQVSASGRRQGVRPTGPSGSAHRRPATSTPRSKTSPSRTGEAVMTATR